MFSSLRRQHRDLSEDSRQSRSLSRSDGSLSELSKSSSRSSFSSRITSRTDSLQIPGGLSKVGGDNQSIRERSRSRDRRNDPLGLTVLYEPDSQPAVDIVFLHGLGGSSRLTWCHDRDPDLFWPQEWLPYESGISSCRVSTFGYNAHYASQSGKGSVFNISDFAKELLFQLRFATGPGDQPLDMGSRPIIFVAHSMGGLVVKKALILGQNDSNYTKITESTTSVVFLSTPHRGSDLADTLNRLLTACIFTSPKHYVAELASNSPAILELNEQFRNVVAGIDLVSFFETQTTVIGPTEVQVLKKDSSTLGYPGEISKPLDADHHKVCKFSSQQDPNYTSVRDILKYLVAKARPAEVIETENDTNMILETLSEALNHPDIPINDLEFFADKRIIGSCEWVFEDAEVRSFLDDMSPRPQALWLHGKPGSGKSVVAASFINMLQEQSYDRVYYFFRFGDQVKNNLTYFLLCIAWQIANVHPDYRRRLSKLFDDGLNLRKSAPRLIWQKLFQGALCKTNLENPIFIVVDALDETDCASLLLKFITDLSTASVPLRFVFISRKTPSLTSHFDKMVKCIPLGTMVIDNSEHDLQLFVEEEIAHMRGDAEFKKATTMKVLQKADGNFLWAHLVVNEILLCHTMDDVEDAINHVPQDLEPLYERMDDALANNIKPADQALGRAILQWVICSRTPLLLRELNAALQPDYPRVLDLEHTISQVCGDFVTIDKRSHVTMIHSSARDFLISNEGLNFHVCVPETHQALFTKCLAGLNTPGTQPRGQRSGFRSSSRGLISSNRAQKIHPSNGEALDIEQDAFRFYAAVSWPYHLKQSGSWADQESLMALARFFKGPNVLQWIYTLCTLKKQRVLVEASKTILDFLKATDKLDKNRSPLTHRLSEKEALESWANDLVRIVGKFSIQLSEHPKTIFSLVPALCPASSILFRQFGSGCAAQVPKISGLSNVDWDECLSKFAVPGSSLPRVIMSIDRYFSITTANGTVRLYHTSTCDEARAFSHGERLLAMAFNSTGDRLATYGFRETKVWDVRTAEELLSIPNPPRAKALAITFTADSESLLTCSDDRMVRLCFLPESDDGWEVINDVFEQDEQDHSRQASPQKVLFNSDCSLVAVAYRGQPIEVWSMDEPRPWLVGRCDSVGLDSRRNKVKVSGAHAMCWNEMTGHLLGISTEGCIFKWHPVDRDLQVSATRGISIECSADGRFFVTSGKDGVLRIWDFEHMTSIYKMSYSSNIQDFAIDRNELRIYDIRDKYCNVWEPNAVLRLLNSDDKASDTTSSYESSVLTLQATDTLLDGSEPVTALATSSKGLHAVGTDDGRIAVIDSTGHMVTDLSERFMTIDCLCWSGDGSSVASVDLGRSVMIEHIAETTGNSKATTSFVANEPDTIFEILLNHDASCLALIKETVVDVWSTGGRKVASSFDNDSRWHWVNHSTDATKILGFSTTRLQQHDWNDSSRVQYWTITLSAKAESSPATSQMLKRAATTFSEPPDHVTKVLFNPTGTEVLMEISNKGTRGRLLKEYRLLELPTGDAITSVSSTRLPLKLESSIQFALGIVDGETIHQRGRHNLSRPGHAVLSPAPTNDQILVFIDQSFWVCSTDISGTCSGNVARHFFLPRDWWNVDWLQMATLTSDGKILCPRNGEVAIISEGLKEEWFD